ncbi:MAG: glycosyltransferase family 2 protein [Candidatus Tectomicrobia bacterium]|uniref:Glycosyltransferase family 2 protein n=1 Tax=Tectimicrobiota bacterium TaxID=2528274 RepID=A0A932HW01_UNCTE|nr:glycosyltransferase family 2 protein [Candidatus Tectomicrobia bacterium]
MSVKVTVYIPTHNYGRFLDRAVQSVLAQTMEDWELIIVDDGSTDDTPEILGRYRSHPKIRILEQENKGLNVTNNIALRLAMGEYMMRLDADDYLDENILLILSNVLDTKPEVGLVYPDYYLVDEKGEVQELVRRKKIGEEVDLLDLPAHGACTMIRKEILLDLGGYSEEFSRQDGYGLWLKFIQRYRPYNVNVPLFYYRQHPNSLTQDRARLLETRRQVKRRFVEGSNATPLQVLAVVPVMADPPFTLGAPFTKLAGKPLIEYTLDEVVKAKLLTRTVLSSSSPEVLQAAGKYPGVVPLLRPRELAKQTASVVDLLNHILASLEGDEGFRPDAICICYINAPFRQAGHIDKAIDTMAIFDVDSVISVQEELSLCYHHGRHGLAPLNGSRDRRMRLEREAIFKENAAIFLSRIEVIRAGRFLGDRIGHITMLPEESVRINSEFEFWMAEKIAIEREERRLTLENQG